MTRHRLEVRPLSRHHWIVRYEGDSVPLSRHRTLSDARQGAVSHARQFGESVIHVYELDDEEHDEFVEPEYSAPAPADVKGPHVEP